MVGCPYRKPTAGGGQDGGGGQESLGRWWVKGYRSGDPELQGEEKEQEK